MAVPGGLADVKYILAGARGCKKRELDIGDITLPVLPADIACADLTRLVVQAPTSVDTMLEFICTLHSLECLTVSSLTMEDIWSDISVPRNGRQGPVTPLDTKLSRLAISTLHRQYLPKLAISVVKYLLLKIPSLAIFYAAQIPREPVQKFVSTYSRWYLHLSNIDLKLYQTGDNARYGA
ncbi:hypothetical protein LPJ61_006237 [Coemansia biformis]|uniref:Uncharacterized protein n=1 Tax=Coemansia biformis TaxID=1286918 RepID=A0A9W7XWX8_9FUNG|nr:hypothetical protein LPJ61_006237 [Coemansia biformis]